jgi:hypothetical protein
MPQKTIIFYFLTVPLISKIQLLYNVIRSRFILYFLPATPSLIQPSLSLLVILASYYICDFFPVRYGRKFYILFT